MDHESDMIDNHNMFTISMDEDTIEGTLSSTSTSTKIPSDSFTTPTTTIKCNQTSNEMPSLPETDLNESSIFGMY